MNYYTEMALRDVEIEESRGALIDRFNGDRLTAEKTARRLDDAGYHPDYGRTIRREFDEDDNE